MTKRVVLAWLLGSLAMYVWSTVAHTVLPLGEVGVREIPNERDLLQAMQTAIGTKDGL